MGGSHSREGLDLSDSDDYEDERSQSESEDDSKYEDAPEDHKTVPIKAVDDLDSKLKALKLKYSSVQNPNLKHAVKLYLHVGGNTPKAKWIVSDKITSYKFVRVSKIDDNNDDDDDDDDDDEFDDEFDDDESSGGFWILKVGSKIRARVSTDMQLKMFGDQRRVDFVDSGVWAMRFFSDEEYREFVTSFQNCLFENVYGLKASDENKVKVYGKDFIGWAKPEVADDSMWEEKDEEVWRTPVRGGNDLLEEFEEAASDGGIQSVALGALDNSFLVNDSGVQVVKNFSHGIHGKGVYTGFSGRMGNKIPAPRLLKLTPVDAHTAGKHNKFHGGRFSWVTESGKQERHLVATVGKFSVIWDFQQVKNSAHECYRNQQGLKSCYCYKLMTRNESIIESLFMHDKFAVSDSPEAPLVVATPQKVTSFSLPDGKGKRSQTRF
ncbi:putative vacuolar import/degradation Vid27 [Helianthus debilis subsp. tardiflorus]